MRVLCSYLSNQYLAALRPFVSIIQTFHRYVGTPIAVFVFTAAPVAKSPMKLSHPRLRHPRMRTESGTR